MAGLRKIDCWQEMVGLRISRVLEKSVDYMGDLTLEFAEAGKKVSFESTDECMGVCACRNPDTYGRSGYLNGEELGKLAVGKRIVRIVARFIQGNQTRIRPYSTIELESGEKFYLMREDDAGPARIT